jgi:hypothetical protein
MYRNNINSTFFDKMEHLAFYYSLIALLSFAVLLLAFILPTFIHLSYHCFELEA